MNKISIAYQIPKHSTAEQCIFSFPALQPPFHKRISDHCSSIALQRREKEMKTSCQRAFKESTAGKKEQDLGLTHFNSLCDTACSQTSTGIFF